ncbi:hypothetical protein LUZ63_020715 [Rhynchospora breviuscula]|uniref:Sporulation and cell division protein SsgA n=1 Tax=Rhynchospora breviuscula TaxID=2022672 RepID=A0A9P9Z935_9POAL|nr:hypothetical protein LUZ63_020715 [Rhynchospora breviuscula]
MWSNPAASAVVPEWLVVRDVTRDDPPRGFPRHHPNTLEDWPVNPDASAHVIHEAVSLDLLGDAGHEGQLDAELRFDSRDPYAMSVVFQTSPAVTWTFGRDLLIRGLYEPCGEGDVQVWPGVTHDGTAVALIEFTSPDGSVVTQVDLRSCHAFVARMLAAVPEGAEADHVDLDAVLEALLGGSTDLSV